MGASSYPPGTPGPRCRRVEVECTNEDCPGRDGPGLFAFEAVATMEIGTVTLRPEECPECGDLAGLRITDNEIER